MTVFLLLFVLLTLLLVMYWLKLPPFFHDRYEADRYVIGYDYGEGTDTSCAVVINRETGEVVDVIWNDDIPTIPSSKQLVNEWENLDWMDGQLEGYSLEEAVRLTRREDVD